MSKGDKRRPTDDKEYEKGWERTFERRQDEVRWRYGGEKKWRYEEPEPEKE